MKIRKQQFIKGLSNPCRAVLKPHKDSNEEISDPCDKCEYSATTASN